MRTPRMGRHGVVGVVVVAVCAMIAGCTAEEPPEARVSEPPASSAMPAPEAAAAAGTESTRPVVAEALPYGEVDERLVYGYFAIPADMIDPLPAVIVVHDWWGLNEQMRATSERLAAEGYIVLSVDLFGGETATSLSDARTLEIAVVENPELALENMRQALDFILNTAGAPRVAVVGFGFGGSWSLSAAVEFDEDLSASVTYYGQVHDDREKLAQIAVPLLGLFAKNDRAVTAETVARFEAALDALEKDHEVVMYPDVRRGFADPLSENFDADIAADAWGRVVEFLDQRMLAEPE